MKTMHFLLFFLVCTLAAGEPQPTFDQQIEAYNVLLQADRFSVGGTGVAGRVREPELALRVLLRDPNPKFFLNRVLERATPAGKVYALCGLYYASPETYRRVVEQYRNSNESFAWQSGCSVMGGARFRSMISVLENGLFASLGTERSDQESATPPSRIRPQSSRAGSTGR